jgi:hypothetical protein
MMKLKSIKEMPIPKTYVFRCSKPFFQQDNQYKHEQKQ